MRTCTMRCIVVAGAALPFPLVYSRCCRSCSARTERDGTSLRDVLVTPSAREIAICFSIRRYLRHLPVVRVSRLCILPYFDTYDNAAALLRGRNLFLICIRSVHGDAYTIVRSYDRSFALIKEPGIVRERAPVSPQPTHLPLRRPLDASFRRRPRGSVWRTAFGGSFRKRRPRGRRSR